MSDALSAARAYMAASKTADLVRRAPAENGTAIDFGALVQNALSDTQDRMGQAERGAMQVAAGRGDLVDVVTAIAAAESSLETVIAVRDQVINAYQEIMRMPI